MATSNSQRNSLDQKRTIDFSALVIDEDTSFIIHELQARDTIVGLALMYCVTVWSRCSSTVLTESQGQDIKTTNKLFNDQALQLRKKILIPSTIEQLKERSLRRTSEDRLAPPAPPQPVVPVPKSPSSSQSKPLLSQTQPPLPQQLQDFAKPSPSNFKRYDDEFEDDDDTDTDETKPILSSSFRNYSGKKSSSKRYFSQTSYLVFTGLLVVEMMEFFPLWCLLKIFCWRPAEFLHRLRTRAFLPLRECTKKWTNSVVLS